VSQGFLRGAIVWVVLVASVAGGLSAQKTDVVVLQNGDRITGEIKQLSRGQLEYSTDNVGRIYIEWHTVARVTSPSYFEVELSSGRKYYGLLAQPPADGQLIVQIERADTLRLGDVVGIVPISNRIVSRLKAYFDLGFTLAKANSARTLTMSGEVAYRGPKAGLSASFDTYSQAQEGVASTTRNTVELNGERYLANRWKYLALTTFEHNDELGLDLRVTLGGGVGRAFIQTNSNEVSFETTLVGTREQFTDTVSASTAKWNLEGRFAGTWDAFRYDSPKLDLNMQLTVFPSITTLGRVRVNASTRVRYELFKDFTVGIDFTDSFDNEPPDATANTNDFVSTFTIGWSYRR
jgi:hypothetical protein